MKLKKFIAKDVRGFLNFDINFRDKVTFLIGINGSGKTTALKLLSGLLTPSYLELSQIEFSNIELECETKNDNNTIKIECIRVDNNIKLSYIDSTDNKTISNDIPIISQTINKRRFDREAIDFEGLNHILVKFDELEVVKKIRNLKTPLFLGLNRRISNTKRYNSYERDDIYRRRNSLDFLFDSVDDALNDIQEMIFNSIRQNARSQASLSEMFRKKVFNESFTLQEPLSVAPEINYDNELNQLKNRKESLNLAVENLGIKDLSGQFQNYFEKIKETLQTLSRTSSIGENKKPSSEYYDALLKWVINSSQIDKIDKIIKYGNEYTDNIWKLREPIIRLEESVNTFLKECDKKIIIDGEGDIKINILNNKKKTNTIFELSSGEKQLIIMLAHLAFCKKNRRTEIFIIDEPELSLHISWQEIFVDALQKASPETQFIMATHAPSIISKNERKLWCENLSK